MSRPRSDRLYPGDDMAKDTMKSRPATRVSPYLVCSLLLGTGALAQDSNRPPAPGTWAVSSAERAEFLLKKYEFVVSGKFVGFPEDVAGDLTRSGPREVVIPFAVSRVYKSYLWLDTIHVQLNADWLRYPGAEISRYSKRLEFRQQHAAWRAQFARQMAELQEAQQNGFITAQEFQEKETELLAIHDAVVAEAVNIPSRGVVVFHGETFHDLGGAIKPDEQYLLGLDWSREHPSLFVLSDFSDRNIFWGQMRDDIAALLERADRP